MSATNAMANARAFLSANRWPIFLAGLLLMSVAAQGTLVFVATRGDSPGPIAGYYERSLTWDADSALLEASRQIGWDVTIDVPEGQQYAVSTRRPVDLTVRDRDGDPVSRLTGRLVTVRPSDARLSGQSELTELPHQPGTYRTLATLGAQGLWELHLDVQQGDTRFVHTARITIATETAP